MSHRSIAAARAFDLQRQDMLQEWRRLIAAGTDTADLRQEIVGTANAMTQLLDLARPDG